MARFFTGRSVGLLDKKNRVVLPAQFRAVLIERGNRGDEVLLGLHSDKIALRGYDATYIDTLEQRIEAECGVGPSVQREYDGANLFATLESVGIDGSGRIVLSETFRDYCQIVDEVYFESIGSYFMMWNPDLAIADYDPKGEKRKFIQRERDRRSGKAVDA